jgi:hypothetical protein
MSSIYQDSFQVQAPISATMKISASVSKDTLDLQSADPFVCTCFRLLDKDPPKPRTSVELFSLVPTVC